jgi:single-strand DNA-binding protein
MSKGLNKQLVIGNLAGDAELVCVGEKNTPKCAFRVIANTGWGDFSRTEGFDFVLWGKRAVGIAAYLTKGTRIFVAGETRTRSWESADGQRRYRTEVIADEIILLGTGAGDSGASTPPDEPLSGENGVPF